MTNFIAHERSSKSDQNDERRHFPKQIWSRQAAGGPIAHPNESSGLVKEYRAKDWESTVLARLIVGNNEASLLFGLQRESLITSWL